MGKVNYVLVNAEILPDVYRKVLKAKNLLVAGEAGSAAEAARLAGVSRSAYYKYKDAIFEYSRDAEEATAAIHARLRDSKGVLSSVMNELYIRGANILSVNQSVPVNGYAEVSITVHIAEITVSAQELAEALKKINGVKSVLFS